MYMNHEHWAQATSYMDSVYLYGANRAKATVHMDSVYLC